MANLTEFDLSGLTVGGIVGALQQINTYANGYLGVSLTVALSVIVFSILAFFGDLRAAFFGSAFSSFGIALVCLSMNLMTPSLFFLFVVINVVCILTMASK